MWRCYSNEYIGKKLKKSKEFNCFPLVKVVVVVVVKRICWTTKMRKSTNSRKNHIPDSSTNHLMASVHYYFLNDTSFYQSDDRIGENFHSVTNHSTPLPYLSNGVE